MGGEMLSLFADLTDTHDEDEQAEDGDFYLYRQHDAHSEAHIVSNAAIHGKRLAHASIRVKGKEREV